MAGWAYLLCFWSGQGPQGAKLWWEHAGHYLGDSATLETLRWRLSNHALGRGARLTQVITDGGMGFRVARLWRPRGSAADFARRLKRRGGAVDICPLCSGDAAWRRARYGVTLSSRTRRLCIEAPYYNRRETLALAS